MPTVRFDIVWKAGATETVVATATHTFEMSAQAFAADLDGSAVPAAAGDSLILRFSVSGPAESFYTPNGDANLAYPGGQIPHLALPE